MHVMSVFYKRFEYLQYLYQNGYNFNNRRLYIEFNCKKYYIEKYISCIF